MHKNLPVILTAVGFGTLAFSLLGTWYLFPKIIESQIHANIDLKEGTMGYDTWKKQPFPLKFKVYLFNVTNAADVQMGAKPIVREIGPFVYDQYRERVNIKLDKQKDVLRYMLKKYYHFNKKDSGCHDQDDVVTIINAALVGTALQVQMILPTAVSMVNDAVPYLFPGTKNIFLTARVRDILFDGIRLHCNDPAVDFICGAMKGALPKTVQQAENGKDFIFSMFRHLNGTDDGPWEMERGMKKNTTRGEVFAWENKELLKIWEEDSHCNMINGSDTTVFERLPKKRPERLYSFSQDFCRSLFIEYERETEEFGIPAARYSNTITPLDYKSGEMTCFCPFVEDDEGEEMQVCPKSGLADAMPCMKAPVWFSYPHFYLGDPSLRDYVQGLNPVKELHEIYANVEPMTATPLSGRKRVQMNIELKRIEEFDLLENVTAGMFPIIWIEEGVTLPDDFVKILKSNFAKIALLGSMKWVMMVFGIGSAAAGVTLILKRERMLCFGKNDTVDITTVKKRATNNSDDANGTRGEDNPAYESNPSLFPQLENKNVNNNRVNNNANNPNRNIAMQQVWHTNGN